MSDLANPTVHVRWGCGCTWRDDTEIGGGQSARFVADEHRLFLALETARKKGGVAAKDELAEALVELELADSAEAAKVLAAKNLAELRKAAYEDLLERPLAAGRKLVDGVTMPVMPTHCPRHGQPALEVHASYLNPADTPPQVKEVP